MRKAVLAEGCLGGACRFFQANWSRRTAVRVPCCIARQISSDDVLAEPYNAQGPLKSIANNVKLVTRQVRFCWMSMHRPSHVRNGLVRELRQQCSGRQTSAGRHHLRLPAPAARVGAAPQVAECCMMVCSQRARASADTDRVCVLEHAAPRPPSSAASTKQEAAGEIAQLPVVRLPPG